MRAEGIESGVVMYHNDLELWALWMMAGKRNAAKTEQQNKRVDKDLSDIQMHYVGLKGEYAVAKFLGIELDMDILLAGDAGHDLVFRDRTIDVKVSQKDLKFFPGKFTADIAVLVQPHTRMSWHRPEKDERIGKPVFAWKHSLISGWVWRKRFEEEYYERDFGYGLRHCMNAEDLHNPYELFRRLWKKKQ